MILEKIKALDIENIGNAEDGIKAGISEDSLPYIFEIVSKQFYSNPIDSIVREITSNCFDAHKEKGVEEPVLIKQTHDVDEGYAIEFQDFGIGISPDRVLSIYMNYFSSTKRENNEQIGGFGLGSKTPLSYTDFFYITTIFDNIKYEYIYHQGEDKPEIDCLQGWDIQKETYEEWFIFDDDSNRIELENPLIKTRTTKRPIGIPTIEGTGTIIKVVLKERDDREKFKLALENQLTYFDSVYFQNWNLSNQYDIYEGQYFKFRSDIRQNNTSIHVCIGKVRYAIDFNKVKIPAEYIRIPIAVKFEIGELQVTPSREQLRYNDKSIELIKKRVLLAVNEVTILYQKQNPVVETLDRWIDLNNDNARITFNEEKRHFMHIWTGSDMSKNLLFKPLADLPIRKTPSDLFFTWEIVAMIDSNGKREKQWGQTPENEFINSKAIVIVTKEDKESIYTDKYIASIHYKQVFLIRKKHLDYDNTIERLGLKTAKITGKAKIIKDYCKAIDKIVKDKAQNYSDLRPTQEWINDYKRSIKESSAAFIRKQNKKIFVRNARFNLTGQEIESKTLHNRTGILVFGFKEDKELLLSIANTVPYFCSNSMKKGKEKAFMVLSIAKALDLEIQGARKTIYCQDFLRTKYFRKIYTLKLLKDLFNSIDFENKSLRDKFIYKFKEDYTVIKQYTDTLIPKDRHEYFYIEDKWLEEVKSIDSILKPVQDFIDKYNYRIPLLGAMDGHMNDIDRKELISYLKYKKIRLRNEFYLKTTEQLEQEEKEKLITLGENFTDNFYENISNDLLLTNTNQ